MSTSLEWDELAQLQRGELHLGRAAAAEDVDVGDRRGLQAGVDVVRDLGDQQVVGVLGRASRATSRATLPLPITATSLASSGQSRGTSGWPSYQETKSAPPKEPSSSMPGNVQVRVLDGAGGEDDGVVEGAEVVAG